MEKRTPHYQLGRVKALIRVGAYKVTTAAQNCADEDFGINDPKRIATCVLGLELNHFYKSMTCYVDHRVWQDVYHPSIAGKPAYVKLQIVSEHTVVISFKLRDTAW